MEACVKRAEASHVLTPEEITALLGAPEVEECLAAAADRVRHAFVGDGVHLRGLIEFSNICRQNCMYCGLRRENGKVERYRLKELDLAVTLSVGERSYEEYALWRTAGADRYLLRIETTDEAVYERWDPGMDYANRVRCLHDLRALGYEVGTGTLVGLPGQSLASIAADILFYQQLDADMVGIGPLIPNPDTPLGTAVPGDFHLTRRMVALLRLLLPEANIPATTAMETMVPHGRELILASGANVVMPNVTEGDPRRNYALYPGKVCVADTPAACRSCMSGRIRAMGRFVAKDKGFRRHRQS